MNWLNLDISKTLRSPEYVGSSPAERGTWLSVHAYAATIECGGVLDGAAMWKDRQWQQAAGVTLREIKSASRLLQIEGDNVIIFGYNVTKQEQVKASRVAGAIGANKRWSIPPAMPPAKETPIATVNAERKEKGKEGEGNTIPPTPSASAPEEKTPRARNELLDALATIGGGDPKEIPPSRWSAVQRCLREIKAVCPDLTVAEIQRRAHNYRNHFNGAVITPEALMKHWPACDCQPLGFHGFDAQPPLKHGNAF